MGKLFKIDLIEEEELIIGYKQRKMYKQFRKSCRAKLKELSDHRRKLQCQYFEEKDCEPVAEEEPSASSLSTESTPPSTRPSSTNHDSVNGNDSALKEPACALPPDLHAELNYYFDLNQFATDLFHQSTAIDPATATNNTNSAADAVDSKISSKSKISKIPKISKMPKSNGVANGHHSVHRLVDEDDHKGDRWPVSYAEYESVLRDIAYNDSTPNFKIFQRAFYRQMDLLSAMTNVDDDDDEDRHSNHSVPWVRGRDIFCCIRCGMHLTKRSLVMDENFHGRTGTAFLIQSVFNVDLGAEVKRKLRTGEHVVSDVFCRRCASNVGWYYHSAVGDQQQYKISHYVLECKLICPLREYMLKNEQHPSPWVPSLDLTASSQHDYARGHGRGRGHNQGRKRKRKQNENVNDGDDKDDDQSTDRGDRGDRGRDRGKDRGGDRDRGKERDRDHDDDDSMHDASPQREHRRGQWAQRRRPLPPWMRQSARRGVSGMYPNRSRDENVYRQSDDDTMSRRERVHGDGDGDGDGDGEDDEKEQGQSTRRRTGNRYQKGPRGLSARNRTEEMESVMRSVGRGGDHDANALTDSSTGRRGSIKSDSSNDSSKTYDDEDDEDDGDDEEDEEDEEEEEEEENEEDHDAERSHRRISGGDGPDDDEEEDDEDEEDEDEEDEDDEEEWEEEEDVDEEVSASDTASEENELTETESNEMSAEETAERMSSMEEDEDHEDIEEVDVD